jgi:hypothetical protein
MLKRKTFLRSGLIPTPRGKAPARRRRPVLEGLEDRALLSLNLTSAFGIGGDTLVANAVAVDSQGNSYVTGYFDGQVNFDPQGASNASILTGNGGRTTFIAKYSPSGKFVWAREFSNFAGGLNYGNGIAVDSATNTIFVVGTLSGAANFSPTGAAVTLSTTTELQVGYIAELTAAGDLDNGLAAKVDLPDPSAPGSFSTGDAVTISGDGSDVYITGGFEGTVDFDSSGAVITRSSADPSLPDSYALRLSNGLAPTNFAQNVNQPDIAAHAIAVDNRGSVYVVGSGYTTRPF